MAPAARQQPRVAITTTSISTLPDLNSNSHTNPLPLFPRQQQDTTPPPTIETPTIPSFYGALGSSPAPGTVAGITLGSVAGFVLLLWLVYTCINMGNPNSGSTNDTSTVVTEGTASVYTRRSGRHKQRRASSRRRSAKETIEIRQSTRGGGPVIVEEVLSSTVPTEVDRVIVEERRRSISRGPRIAHAHPPAPSDFTAGTEDEVVVIEEHSPPSRRHRSRVRSGERRSSGYREVDPDRFAGGEASFVEVRRSGSRR